MGWICLPNANTNIFKSHCLDKFKYKYILYSLPKMGKNEYKYNYSDWYLQTQIQINIYLYI